MIPASLASQIGVTFEVGGRWLTFFKMQNIIPINCNTHNALSTSPVTPHARIGMNMSCIIIFTTILSDTVLFFLTETVYWEGNELRHNQFWESEAQVFALDRVRHLIF